MSLALSSFYTDLASTCATSSLDFRFSRDSTFDPAGGGLPMPSITIGPSSRKSFSSEMNLVMERYTIKGDPFGEYSSRVDFFGSAFKNGFGQTRGGRVF